MKEPARISAHPLEEAPRDGSTVYFYKLTPIRWTPYGSRQGVEGRWQEHNGHDWVTLDQVPDYFFTEDEVSIFGDKAFSEVEKQ